MAPIIYQNTGPTPWVDVPNLDLLTLLFDSEHAPFQPETPSHLDSQSPTNCLTRAQLLTLSQRIAHGLRTNHGLGASGLNTDVVTVISYGQILVPALFYGVLIAGGVYSAASPSSTVGEFARQIELGKSKLVVISQEFEALTRETLRLHGQRLGIGTENVLVLDSTPDKWSLRTLDSGDSAISSRLLDWERITDPKKLKESLIVILWSSGTTGLPKGVMLSHQNLVCETYLTALSGRAWGEKQLQHDPSWTPTPYRTLAHLPLSHIAGLFGYIIGPLYSGGLVVWMRKYNWKQFYESVSKFQITFLYTVPSIFLRIAKSPEVADHFRTVETANTGAASMDGPLQRAANSKLGKRVGGVGKEETFIGQTWGLSETTGAITAQPKGEVDDTGCIGSVLPNVEIRQIDTDTLRDVEPGTPGHMVVRSPLVTQGYFGNPEATEKSFVVLPDTPKDPGEKWFLTGDIAVYRDGKFYIVDREKEILKYKGQQIAPAEVENVLATHEAVGEAAVVGVEDGGESGAGEVPRAYVVKRPGVEVSEDELKRYVKERMAEYKQLRGGVVFVDEIPKNAIGKYLRRELRERAKREVGGGVKARL
ncbi:putative acyl-coenzyme A synthetase [Cyphellophora attinorum]|uniref:Putative acyl-coenzyme A synthetase n=1 Tax=Cyphellophora attinorum TaxID=1664694 RepID=A0A0N1H7F0_9EURO|nr:putative acyl-coenzyme A synthetase [Phialophora attinorum]KPI37517.1 putative acyl-coenzyme A synthetase [Phialophora attinorum]